MSHPMSPIPHRHLQAAIAEQYLKRLQQKYDRPVVTELRDATVFWPAVEPPNAPPPLTPPLPNAAPP